ncbi:hypothetical protein FQR65_LT03611 [Abscondita terminalis]|nr:hypothetical protein FQR65_LT03611 [Abscondita terminalis]
MSAVYLILYKSENIELVLPSDATIETLKKGIYKKTGLHPTQQDLSELNDAENNELLSRVCPPGELIWLSSKKKSPKRNYSDKKFTRPKRTVSSSSDSGVSNDSASRSIPSKEQVNEVETSEVSSEVSNSSTSRDISTKEEGNEVETSDVSSEVSDSITSGNISKEKEVNDNVEETAYFNFIQTFTVKYGRNHIDFQCCSLKEALQRCHTTTTRKMLLLYFHNKNDKLSEIVCKGFIEGEMRTILQRSYNVLAWNVSNNIYQNLKNVLDEWIELMHLKQLLQKSALIIINPSVQSILVLDIMYGDTLTLSNICEQLKSAEKGFQASLIRTRDVEELELATRQNNDIGSREFHQMMFDRLGDRDYDSFEPNQHTYLKDKIGFAKYGPPQSVNGYNIAQKDSIDETYKVIVYNSNHFAKWKDRVVISFIYNCIEPLPELQLEKAKKIKDYNPYTDIRPTPIFVIRKCKNSVHPCRIFVDYDNRVYSSWEDYITNNKLEKAMMVLPKGGRYYGDANGQVVLEKHHTPSSSIQQTLLQHADTASSVVGIASGGVLLTTVIPAVALGPIAVSAAVAAGVGVGAYSIFRSSCQVYDRLMHGESMSFTNSEARGAYLNIIAGTLGFVGAGATGAMSQLAAEGVQIGEGARAAVNVLNIANASLGAAALANASYDMYDTWKEGGTISTLSLIQLGSSVLFFGNAVYSFRTANTIINESQTNALRNHQESLRSNRHRKTFNKLLKETIRQNNGNVQAGRAEVISSISNMANRDESFALLTRNNKRFNKNGVRFAAKMGKLR